MVHAKSTVPTPLLEQWLRDPVTMLDKADFWVSAGSREHWEWSLNYSQKYEEGYTYWGSRIDADQLQGIFEEAIGVRLPSRKLFEGLLLANNRPNVVLFYVSGIGIVGAGLVVECEFDFLNLFWPEERRNKKIEFPFRYKLKILWLHESVSSGAWLGDRDLTSLLVNYSRSGLQHVTDIEVIVKLRSILKERIARPPTPAPYSWLDRLNVGELEARLLEKGLVFSGDLLYGVIAALRSGKHVILVGPPGAGKTILARTLAEVYNVPILEKTATSEWSRVDVIGGPTFVGGEVIWKCGALLEALARCYENEGLGVILLIDEINRANLDKAFGEFFTIFGSSDPREWCIPDSLVREMKVYQANNKIDPYGNFLLKVYEENGELRVPKSFRIIATMNIYDRRYLFTLGYALLRRFAVVEVSNPDFDKLLNILDKLCRDSETAKSVLNIYQQLKDTAKLELGVALLIDMAKVASELVKQGLDREKALDRAIAMVVIPQLEGLLPPALEKFKEALKGMKFEYSLKILNSLYPELGELEG